MLSLQKYLWLRRFAYYVDITWETAEEILIKAEEEEAAIVRVLNSQVHFTLH